MTQEEQPAENAIVLAKIAELQKLVESIPRTPESISGSGQSYREAALGAGLEVDLRNEMLNVHYGNNLSFGDALNRELLIGSTAQQGISNFYANRKKRPVPYIFITAIIASALVFYGVITNPSTGPGLAAWLGRGYNAPIVFLFLIALMALYFANGRRKNSRIQA